MKKNHTVIIPHSRPSVGTDEIRALTDVIRSGQLAQGPQVEALERELSRVAGKRHGVAVSSGTAALYLAMRAMGIRAGQTVVIPSYVCTALLNAVVACGAKPSLADVDPSTGLLTSDTVRKSLRRGTGAVIVPHLFGSMADVRGIARLGVPVIEDCAQCAGTSRDGAAAGETGVVSVFSLYATKLLAAGEGGLVATSDGRIAARVRDLREYDNRDCWEPGFNLKLSDLHAAVARVQLRRLPAMVRSRRELARAYAASLSRSGAAALPLRVAPSERPVYFRYVVFVPGPAEAAVAAMERRGIACRRPVYKPLHAYLGTRGLPGTEEIHSRAISLPIHPDLGRAQVAAIAGELSRIVS